MEKFIQLGKEFVLEGEMLLQFVRGQEEKKRNAEKKNARRKAERKNVRRNLGSLKKTKKRNVGS